MGILDFLVGGGIRRVGEQTAANQLQALGEREISDFDRLGLGSIRDIVLASGNLTRERVQDATQEATQRAGAAFDTSAGILERTQRTQDISARQRKAQGRRLNLRRALGQVDASNRAIEGLRAERGIVRRSAGSIRDAMFGQALTAASGAAEEEATRNVDFLQQQADAVRARARGIGELAGAVGSAFGGGF